MADGFAKASGRLGVCLSIGNVGATNLATALLIAKSDRSPVLFVTGAPPLALSNYLPFQDIGPSGSNDREWIGSLVKSSVLVKHPDELLERLIEAEKIAYQYPKGPVHIIIPSCVQTGLSEIEVPTKIPDPIDDVFHHAGTIDQALRLLSKSKRAVALVGERTLPTELVEHFAETFAIPVATTLEAKGLLAKDNPMCLGSFGFAGMPLAKEALLNEEIDLLILIGISLGERNSHNWDPRLIKGRSIISLGSLELPSRQSESFVQIGGACIKSLTAINTRGAKISQKDPDSMASNQAWIRDLRNKYSFAWPSLSSGSSTRITTDRLIAGLEDINRDINLVVDAGGARFYSGLYWWPIRAQSFFLPNASGAMGWSLGAGAGVYLANPEKPTVVLIGDGSLWMFGNELATLVKYQIPLLVVLLNNSGYGTVSKRYNGEEVTNLAQTPEINWCAYAGSMGCEVQRIESLDHFKRSADAYFENFTQGNSSGPLLLEIITPSENVFPSGALTTNGYQEDPFKNGF